MMKLLSTLLFLIFVGVAISASQVEAGGCSPPSKPCGNYCC